VEGIQTDGHRGLTPPGRETRPENRSGGHLGHQLDLALFRYHIAWVATGGQTIAAAQSAEKAGHRQSARELHLRARAFQAASYHPIYELGDRPRLVTPTSMAKMPPVVGASAKPASSISIQRP
jgi:hypothetical protein